MASVAGRRLTEAHRLAQARLGAQTVARLRAVFPVLDPSDLDRTYPTWLAAALPIIQLQREASSRLAANYLAAFKQIETGRPAPAVITADPAPPDAVATSLLVTGPISLKKAATRGVPLNRALSVAQAASSASAMRHVLNGGRETIVRTVDADPDAVGWQRVTSGRPCQFCSELAAQGTAPASADVQCHDGCSCTAEPVWS